MIAVEEARRIVMAHVPVMKPVVRGLADALGGYVASDVIAPNDHPLFDMSAVDGYAFTYTKEPGPLTIDATIAAGDTVGSAIERGGCARIFTGAMLPGGTDTVVMQEFVTVNAGTITHTDQRLVQGANVRYKAEQLKQGEVVLPKGTWVTPAAIGLLASIGVREVPVIAAPDVAVLVTGDEFVRGGVLLPGRIFSSNDHMMDACLRTFGAVPHTTHVADDLGTVVQAIEQAGQDHGVIITTGGASVGDHDLIHEAVLRVGGTIHFHGVAQKPGKPMLFATVMGKPFFGLPGNPRAVLVLFHEYVLPFLKALRGASAPFPVAEHLPLTSEIRVKGERAEFRAARVQGGAVGSLADEGSHMLRSLIEANAIVYLPADRRSWQAGDLVEVHYLPR
ncbi:MAG: molybdopterin molybdotransferase MoeA [Flavobacteriales bacterium]|jgi:molybdopterin molybdotransferase|nr:molybdopterin molybdotransferase MoeA [Flavobacteriales bacterium]